MRLEKRFRLARAAMSETLAKAVRENTAGRKSQALDLATAMTGNGRERSVRAMLLGTRHENAAALKQHSMTRGCSAPFTHHSPSRIGHATISGLIRGAKAKAPKPAPRQRLWSQRVEPKDLPGMVLDGQCERLWQGLLEGDRAKAQALGLYEYEERDARLPNDIQGVRLAGIAAMALSDIVLVDGIGLAGIAAKACADLFPRRRKGRKAR